MKWCAVLRSNQDYIHYVSQSYVLIQHATLQLLPSTWPSPPANNCIEAVVHHSEQLGLRGIFGCIGPCSCWLPLLQENGPPLDFLGTGLLTVRALLAT